MHQFSYPVKEPYGLGYEGNTLYVCDKSGLEIYDIGDPYTPKRVKTITGDSFIDVIPYQGILICWVTGGMRLYDISDNRNPQLLANIL